MATLLDFLIDNPVDDLEEELVVSKRLENFPFKIRAMTGPEFSDYQKAAMKIGRHRKVEFNTTKFNELVVLNHTVVPNFKDAESLKKANCKTPEEFLYKSLLAGEISELASRISTLSGFDQSLDEVVDEAKNS